MQNNYQLLIKKLDEFIGKYYRNQLIRGAIYFTSAILLSFLLIIILEYFGRYNSTVRAVLFYSFSAFTLFCLIRFLIIPLSKLYRIGKTIDHKDASKLIGTHFPEVKDKLLNTLQLKSEADGFADTTLIHAAINQKIEQLKPVPFATAIDFRKNFRYAKYALIPLFIYIIILLVSPGMIIDSSQRIIRFNQTFKLISPFSLAIENPSLKTQQYTDYELTVKAVGTELPEEAFIIINGNPFKLQKKNKNTFTYTFSNVQKSMAFKLHADKYFSENYVLEVLAKPVILNYQVHLNYPSYIGKKDETVNNPGDLTIPAGTEVKWKFITQQTDDLILGFGGPEMKAEHKEKDLFSYIKKFFLSGTYYIKNLNAKVSSNDSMLYNINVVPDAFPVISVEEKADSLTGKQLYFIGDANDDYGLTKLTFNYRFVKSDNKENIQSGLHSKVLPLDKKELSQRFYHQFDLNEVQIEPADEVEYYFELWDNDGVHGPKSSRSKTMMFKAPSIKELEEKTEAGNSAMKDKMEEALKEAQRLQKEMKELERKMLDKKELTWEEKKKLEELLERQKELNKKIEEIKQQNKQQNEKEAEYKKQNEQILEKQQQIEKMFNELMTDEMKKLIKQLEQMMQQQNKDQIKQEMDKMQLSNKDVQKELDRMLEQFKQLELEKKIDDALSKLDKLAEKEENLSKKNEEIADDKKLNKEEKKLATDEVKKEQEELKKQFEELQKDLKDIDKKNKELEDPKQLENTDKEEQDINNEMKESEDQLSKGDNKKSSQKQKNASKKMKEMGEKMKSGMKEQEEKELDLDIDAMREILENTVQLSKDQEELMERLKKINGYNPQFVEIAQEQKKVKDNAKIIEDSLLALSKKVREIKSYVNREVSKLNDNLDKSVKAFGLRNFGDIRTRQQWSMTHANNLAVMLSEILQQMQQQQQESKSGKQGKKPKPGQGNGMGKGKGGKKPSFGSMKKMQEELNKQLREGLNKNGTGEDKKPGEGKQGPGGQQGQGKSQQNGGMGSEQFARMAAQQMAIRQQMLKMMQQMGNKEKDQLGGGAKLNELQKLMEQTEKELFNKKLTGELLMRQQDILTRLLDSEKAERRQEQDNKREAEQAKEKPKAIPPDFEKYIKQKNKEKELLETIPAELQPYYKEKAKEYFNKIGG